MPTTLITGAASGIGAATARHLKGQGHTLILMDRDGDALAAAFPTARHLVGDVADPALWIEADLTGLTHAVINAGVGGGGPIEDMSLAEWRSVMHVNLDGAFLSLQAAMRAIRAAGQDGKGSGAIVVTASAAGIKAEPGIAAYAASKAAVIQLAKVAAKEGAAANIRVNAIAPGGVETPIWAKQPFFQELIAAKGSQAAAYAAIAGLATPLGRYARPEEIAAQIAFLLSEDCAFMTGTVLVTDGGYSL